MRFGLLVLLGSFALGACRADSRPPPSSAGRIAQPPPSAASRSAPAKASAASPSAPAATPPAPATYVIARAPRFILDELTATTDEEPQIKALLETCQLDPKAIDRIDAVMVPPDAVRMVVVGDVSKLAVSCLVGVFLPELLPKIEAKDDGVVITTRAAARERETGAELDRALTLLDAHPADWVVMAARVGRDPAWKAEVAIAPDTPQEVMPPIILSSTPAELDRLLAWWQAALAEKAAVVPFMRDVSLTRKGAQVDLVFEGEAWEDLDQTFAHSMAFRKHVLESFNVPSGSMLPTLFIGDMFFVDKTGRAPDRGDVIVFPLLDDPRRHYVKRLIARPGDDLAVLDGRPIVNGLLLPHCYVGRVPLHAEHAPQEVFVEYLGPHRYLTAYDAVPTQKTCRLDADCPGGKVCRQKRCGHLQGPYLVGSDEVWVLGDNRDNSLDSRAFRRTGAGVPIASITGRATVRYFHPSAIDRAFTRIDDVIFEPKDPAARKRLVACLDTPPAEKARTPPAPRQ